MISPNSYDTGRKIVINPDVTCTSESICAQATRETIEAWAKAVSDYAPNSVVRVERANFNICALKDILAYYDDVFSALNRYGLGWFSNDYINIITGDAMIVGFTPTYYQNKKYCIEILQTQQQWQ